MSHYFSTAQGAAEMWRPGGATATLLFPTPPARDFALACFMLREQGARTTASAAGLCVALVRPTSDQRVGSVEQPHGCSRRALRVGAPQGPKDFGERSDAKVYGATPSSAVKETTTLPKVHWGDGRSRGRRSPSGESPKASTGATTKSVRPSMSDATTKSVHPSMSVEGGEA